MKCIVNGRILLPKGEVEGKTLAFENGRIEGLLDAPPAGAEIIDAGDVGPIVLRLTQLEEDFLSFPWRRPEGLLTDQSGNEIEDENGDPINITTLSLAEVAAGVINAKLHR